jgi:hypothetical protein
MQSFERWAVEQERRYTAGEIATTPPFPVVLRPDVGRAVFLIATRETT